MVLVTALLALLAGHCQESKPANAPNVRLVRVPEGGIQPQVALAGKGTLELLFFRGDPIAGDLFLARSRDGGATFAAAFRVNHDDGDAIAIGNIRGAQLARGRQGRVHVAWMGSAKSKQRGPKNASPMLYSRSNDQGDAFEVERNVLLRHPGLDGGGTIAADLQGHVWVAWHAPRGKSEDEAQRGVFITRSDDDGKSFGEERLAWDEATGACGCCGMRAFADDDELLLLYRGAKQEVNRDLFALVSRDAGKTFGGTRVAEWRSAQCVMSTAAATSAGANLLAAWEDEGEVAWARVQGSPPKLTPEMRPTNQVGGTRAPRKHPSIAANRDGVVLLAWTEGMGWERGGTLVWQLFTAAGKAIDGASGRQEGVPTWSLVAAAALEDGSFVIVY